MTKEEFIVILERQQSSGLSIKDFCLNESYTASSFHYWKSRFGMCRPYHSQGVAEMGFSRIYPGSSGSNSTSNQTGKINQIEVAFPNGITIRLNNFDDSQAAGAFLSQTLDRYVLPKYDESTHSYSMEWRDLVLMVEGMKDSPDLRLKRLKVIRNTL